VGKRKKEKKKNKKQMKFIKKEKREQKPCLEFRKFLLPCFAYGDQIIQTQHESPYKMLMTQTRATKALRSH